jgi:hypothetical protein
MKMAAWFAGSVVGLNATNDLDLNYKSKQPLSLFLCSPSIHLKFLRDHL